MAHFDLSTWHILSGPRGAFLFAHVVTSDWSTCLPTALPLCTLYDNFRHRWHYDFRHRGQIGLLPKFWPIFGWIPKFAHLSHLPYQNMGKFLAQHLASQNFGMLNIWYQA